MSEAEQRASVLVAPDSFKGTFTASEVAQAIGRGLGTAGLTVDLCPVADGGEGTLDVLATALAATVHAVTVGDPLGRAVDAAFALAGELAIVETAAASGLELVAVQDRDAVAASTAGTGELIVVAVAAGARTVYLGVGGSATTDGGSGAIQIIERAGGLDGARLVVLCDVRTPFEQAARVFAPQKGANAAEVELLSERLAGLAETFPKDPRGVPLTGAAGGLAGGLWATFGAELVAGAGFVLDSTPAPGPRAP
jgi:glycerate 2-kinase